MNTEIWVAVIGAFSLITVAIVGQAAQLLKSKKEGVESDEVQTQPAVPQDPNEGWKEYVAGLRARAERAEAALEAERSLRWAAIHYIRKLLEWISRHYPAATPPEPPDGISPYITGPRKDES